MGSAMRTVSWSCPPPLLCFFPLQRVDDAIASEPRPSGGNDRHRRRPGRESARRPTRCGHPAGPDARPRGGQADSLPVRALEAKALEGSAKQIPGPQIVRAVERMAGDMREARLLVMSSGAPAPSDELVIAATDARRRGVPANEVATLAHTSAADGPLLHGDGRTRDLVQRGVPAGKALATVTTAPRERGHRGGNSPTCRQDGHRLASRCVPIDALAARPGGAARGRNAGPPPSPPGRSGEAPGRQKK